jgi:hypothetical protein
MGARSRQLLLVLLMIITAAFGGHDTSSTALADPICPSGTHWDNRLHQCV